MKTNMKSSSATEASLAMLANTTRDKNSKERKSLIETYKKLIARTIIIILLHFYFIILHWSLMHLWILKEDQWKVLCSSGKIKNRTETKSCFYSVPTLTVGCENLSLQSKYDKALHYCSDRSSFCHDLEMKTLIILLSNCHSISSSWGSKNLKWYLTPMELCSVLAIIYLYYIKTLLMIFQPGNLRKATISKIYNKRQNQSLLLQAIFLWFR
jgi:hypothetical protein